MSDIQERLREKIDVARNKFLARVHELGEAAEE